MIGHFTWLDVYHNTRVVTKFIVTTSWTTCPRHPRLLFNEISVGHRIISDFTSLTIVDSYQFAFTEKSSGCRPIPCSVSSDSQHFFGTILTISKFRSTQRKNLGFKNNLPLSINKLSAYKSLYSNNLKCAKRK